MINASNNARLIFMLDKPLYDYLTYIDYYLLEVCNNLINLKNESIGMFLMRSHSGYRVACQLAMSGQVAESFPVLRTSLEYSLYALHIHKNPPAFKLWFMRNQNANSKKAMLKEFTTQKIKQTLKTVDPKLFKVVDELYQQFIDLGAHPNPMAIAKSLTVTDTDEGTEFAIEYLHGRSIAVYDVMLATAKAGLTILRIFENIIPERFEIVGASAAIQELRKSL